MNASSWWSIAALLVTSLTSIVALFKEKPKHRKRRLTYILLTLTVLASAVGSVLIWQTSKDNAANELKHAAERSADKLQIAGLTQSVETQTRSNETQYIRNQDELYRLQDQLTELRKQVATEEVRKKMEALQVQLDRALAPAPKAKLEPFFWQSPRQDTFNTDTYASVDAGIVTINLALLNRTDVNAKNIAFWIRICDVCKFNKEPQGSERIDGAGDFERLYKIGDLPSGTQTGKFPVEIQVPPNYGNISVATKYRCENCEIENNWRQMNITLNIMRR